MTRPAAARKVRRPVKRARPLAAARVVMVPAFSESFDAIAGDSSVEEIGGGLHKIKLRLVTNRAIRLPSPAKKYRVTLVEVA